MTKPVPETIGTGPARALAFAVGLTAVTAPLAAAYLDEISGYHDASEGAIARGYLLVGAIVVAIFLPAIVVIAAGAPTSRAVLIGTLWLLLCVWVPYNATWLIGEAAAFVAFPLGGIAALLGATRQRPRESRSAMTNTRAASSGPHSVSDS